MYTGPALLRRAAYDAMPLPYLVTGHEEQYVVSTADKTIGRELFLHGEFDFAKLLVALDVLADQALPPTVHLIDVGANIGTITIPALKRGLVQTATAIEPHPENLKLLRANIALNELDQQVTVLAHAVGDVTNEVLHLIESATNSGNHSISENGLPVRSSRLDDLALRSTQSLLWMDIEGYEGHALSGAKQMLAMGMPVVCEFNPDFLRQSGGMQAFLDALQGRRIFDLGASSPTETTIDAITQRLAGKPKRLQWTDILAIV